MLLELERATHELRGTADGALFSVDAPMKFNLEDFLPHYTKVPGGLFNNSFAFFMSERDWDGLGVDNQAAIAPLIGKPLSRQPGEEEIRDAISGFAPALDLTLRDVQAKLKEKGHPWELAKSFDGACVLAPFVPGDAVEDLGDIGIRLTLNGEVRQDGNSSQMLNTIVPLIRHIAGHFSLQPGDVVLTGTPAGVGPLQSGDQLVLELVGLSRFESRVL